MYALFSKKFEFYLNGVTAVSLSEFKTVDLCRSALEDETNNIKIAGLILARGKFLH